MSDWWLDTLNLLRNGSAADVVAPPCAKCRHFRPRLDTHPSRPDAFSLCQVQTGQYQDFSCFESQ